MASSGGDNLSSAVSSLEAPNSTLTSQLTSLLQSGDTLSVDNMLQMQSTINNLTVDTQMRSAIIKSFGDILKSILQKIQ